MTVGGSAAWEGTVYHLCDYAGTTGLSVAEWQMDISYTVDLEGTPIAPGMVLMTLSSPRLYLNSSKRETGDTWNFNYNLVYADTSGTGMSLSVPVSGIFQDEGMTDIEVMGETMEAWHISSTYNMSTTAITGFTRDYPGEADYYWVDGLGLVQETHTDTGTGATVLAKELSSTSGL